MDLLDMQQAFRHYRAVAGSLALNLPKPAKTRAFLLSIDSRTD